MRPAFIGHQVASTVLAATFVIWVGFELRQAFRRRPEAKSQDRNSLNVVRLTSAAGALLAYLAVSRAKDAALQYNDVAFGIGLLLMWAGIGLRFWSFHTLGRYFTFTVMTSTTQPVITAGPYRVLRHPSYAGILLILAGIGVTYGNWLSLAALTLLPLIGFLNRIRVEEAALSATLGEPYDSYARTTKRLIPFVW